MLSLAFLAGAEDEAAADVVGWDWVGLFGPGGALALCENLVSWLLGRTVRFGASGLKRDEEGNISYPGRDLSL